MKKYIILLIAISLLFSCDDSDFNNNNPFLPNYSFAMDINTNLPSFSNLKFANNGVYLPGIGVSGVFIFNTGTGYTAFDAACPNQSLSDCSTMSLKTSIAVCSCDNAEYTLYSGQCIGKECTGKQYSMKQYRVEVNGNSLRVYN